MGIPVPLVIVEIPVPPKPPLVFIEDDQVPGEPAPPEFEAHQAETDEQVSHTIRDFEDIGTTIRVTVEETIHKTWKCVKDVIDAIHQIPELVRLDPDQELLAVEDALTELEKPIRDFELVAELVADDVSQQDVASVPGGTGGAPPGGTTGAGGGGGGAAGAPSPAPVPPGEPRRR